MTGIGFLRAELSPMPGRARAATRLTVAALVGAFLVLSFHIPHGVWVVFTVFLLSQANAGASLDKGLQRAAGTVVGGLGAMIVLPLIVGAPWCEIPLVALGVGLALFLSRTTNASYTTFLAGLTFMILLREVGPQERVGIEALWRIGTVMLGIVVGTAAQLLLWPDDPEDLLLDDLTGELARVRSMVASTARLTTVSKPRLDSLAASHLGRRLDLVANAEVRYPSLRRRHADLIALVVQIDRLLSAVLWLERVVDGPLPSAVSAMLEVIAAECERLGQALAAHRAPEAACANLPGRGEAFAAASPAMLPALVEIEGALQSVHAHLSFLRPDADREASPLDAAERRPFLTPACSLSNVEALHYALKGSLAVSICYVLMNGLNWPGISTCAITCVIVAQSTVGASLRKAWLRVCGATTGGLLAAAVVLIVTPFSNNIAVFLTALAVCFGIAAWITVGSPRISYVGIQIAYALAMCLLTVFGPGGNLVAGRDRVIGILIGIVVWTLVNLAVSPSFAVSHMRRHLAATFRYMADVCRVGLHGPESPLVRPKGLRQAVYQNLAAVGQLDDEAESEPQARDPRVIAERGALLAMAADMLETLPGLFTIARHWLDIDLREALGETGMTQLINLALATAGTLDAMADRVEGTIGIERPNLAAELAQAEAALQDTLFASTALIDGQTAHTHVEARLALWRALLPALERLAADVEALPPPKSARKRP